MKKHAANVMRTVGEAVAGLSDVRTLIPMLEALGSRHAKYGVQPEHFAIVGQALLWTLEQALGELWTPEVKDAWVMTYAAIQKVMEPQIRIGLKNLALARAAQPKAVKMSATQLVSGWHIRFL